MGSSRNEDMPGGEDKPPQTVPNVEFGRMAAACRHSKPARLIQVEATVGGETLLFLPNKVVVSQFQPKL